MAPIDHLNKQKLKFHHESNKWEFNKLVNFNK